MTSIYPCFTVTRLENRSKRMITIHTKVEERRKSMLMVFKNVQYFIIDAP